MQALIEYRITENILEQKKVKIKDGVFKLRKREYLVDKNKDMTLIQKTSFFGLFKKTMPFYRIKHDRAYPLTIDEKSGTKLNYQNPETIKLLSENGTMKALMKLQTADKMNLMLVVMAGAIGGMAGYIIAGMGVVP